MSHAVIDVGSNTIRLLVADVRRDTVVPLAKERVRLALGEEIERHGVLSDTSVAAAAKAVRKLTGVVRRRGVESLDVFVTAPGRQSENADELVAALARAAEHPVRILTTEAEGTLAYRGAVATAKLPLLGGVAVCDVGGASTEIAFGEPGSDPARVMSVDLGSVRLSVRAEDFAHASAEARAAFSAVKADGIRVALAVGGSARATRRLVGGRLGERELAEASRLVTAHGPGALGRRFGFDRGRARVLPGGVAILAEVQSRLGLPLYVCDGGIREGAVLASAEDIAA